MITAENARELQLKGAASKRLHKANRLLAMSKVEVETQSVTFIERSLARVRLQLDKVYETFMSERDPQKLDRLAAAQARLNEQERQLSNRSMPPTIRAGSKTTRARPDAGSFHEPEAPPAAPTCGPDTPTGSVPPNNPNLQTPQDG